MTKRFWWPVSLIRKWSSRRRAHEKLILVSYKSLLMLWLCAIAAGPFLQINHLAQPWVLVAYSLIAVASGMLFALKPRWWPLGVVVLVGNTLGWLWWLFPSAGWLWTFWERFFTALRQFLLVGGLSVPQIVSVPLVFIVIAFLAVLIIGLDHYLIAWIVVFSYLLAVHVFNGNDLLLVFAQMGAVGLAFLGLHRYAEQPRRLLRWLIVTTVLVAGITVLNQNVASLNNALVDQTVSLRNWLNDRGFYQAISAYARQNMRTGLSENDRVLGGPVYDDPTPVVTVTQKTPHYFGRRSKACIPVLVGRAHGSKRCPLRRQHQSRMRTRPIRRPKQSQCDRQPIILMWSCHTVGFN